MVMPRLSSIVCLLQWVAFFPLLLLHSVQSIPLVPFKLNSSLQQAVTGGVDNPTAGEYIEVKDFIAPCSWGER